MAAHNVAGITLLGCELSNARRGQVARKEWLGGDGHGSPRGANDRPETASARQLRLAAAAAVTATTITASVVVTVVARPGRLRLDGIDGLRHVFRTCAGACDIGIGGGNGARRPKRGRRRGGASRGRRLQQQTQGGHLVRRRVRLRRRFCVERRHSPTPRGRRSPIAPRAILHDWVGGISARPRAYARRAARRVRRPRCRAQARRAHVIAATHKQSHRQRSEHQRRYR